MNHQSRPAPRAESAPPQDILEKLVALHEAGHTGVVIEEAGKLLQVFPTDYTLWHIFGGVLLEVGQYVAAQQALGQAAALRPDLAEAQSNHSVSLRACEDFTAAEDAARRAVTLAPGSAQALVELSAVMNAKGDVAAARNLSDQALKLDKRAFAAWCNKGVALQALGQRRQAVRAFEKAVEIAPKFAEAHRNLSAAKRWAGEDAQLRQMLALHADPATPLPDRMRVCFGLFDAYNALDDTARAYGFLAEGNALRKSLSGYDISVDEERFDLIRARFGALTPLDVPPADIQPVFILGMPRSGTTLVEQIISAHSAVSGGGEMPLIGRLAQPLLAAEEVTERDLYALRETYLEEVRAVSGGRRVVTDKMPHNFRDIGLIAAALPEARIVHVVRIPEAVCWSNLRQFFVAEGLGYAYDPDDVVLFYGLYRDLMQFWEARWPGRLLHVDYDALTSQPDDAIPGLISDLGLCWDPACLRPEENRRAVQTASVAQVRHKVYHGSSRAWTRYAPFVSDSFAALHNQAAQKGPVARP